MMFMVVMVALKWSYCAPAWNTPGVLRYLLLAQQVRLHSQLLFKHVCYGARGLRVLMMVWCSVVRQCMFMRWF
jgi:hypothetical protein